MTEEVHSREFLEKKECLLIERQIIELRHRYKMEELEFERSSMELRHQFTLKEIHVKSKSVQRARQSYQIQHDKHLDIKEEKEESIKDDKRA